MDTSKCYYFKSSSPALLLSRRSVRKDMYPFTLGGKMHLMCLDLRRRVSEHTVRNMFESQKKVWLTSSLPLLRPVAMRLPLSSMAQTELSQSPLLFRERSGNGAGWSPRLRRLCCDGGGEGGKGIVGEVSCSWYAFSTNPPKSKPELLVDWEGGKTPKLVSISGVRSGWPPNMAGRAGVVLLLIGKISTSGPPIVPPPTSRNSGPRRPSGSQAFMWSQPLRCSQQPLLLLLRRLTQKNQHNYN